MTIPFYGKVEDGKIQICDKKDFELYIRSFEGKLVQVTVQCGGKRSTQQNRFLWGICYKILSEYTGHTVDEIHAFCKLKFNPQIIEIANKKTGEIESAIVGETTTQMTTMEFGEYVSQIQIWAAEMNCLIPDPNQVD